MAYIGTLDSVTEDSSGVAATVTFTDSGKGKSVTESVKGDTLDQKYLEEWTHARIQSLDKRDAGKAELDLLVGKPIDAKPPAPVDPGII